MEKDGEGGRETEIDEVKERKMEIGGERQNEMVRDGERGRERGGGESWRERE